MQALESEAPDPKDQSYNLQRVMQRLEGNNRIIASSWLSPVLFEYVPA